jgi:hypothetical protein
MAIKEAKVQRGPGEWPKRVLGVSPELRTAIQVAFSEAMVMDVYRGDAVVYVQVMGQQLRDQRERIEALELIVRQAMDVLSID